MFMNACCQRQPCYDRHGNLFALMDNLAHMDNLMDNLAHVEIQHIVFVCRRCRDSEPHHVLVVKAQGNMCSRNIRWYHNMKEFI